MYMKVVSQAERRHIGQLIIILLFQTFYITEIIQLLKLTINESGKDKRPVTVLLLDDQVKTSLLSDPNNLN